MNMRLNAKMKTRNSAGFSLIEVLIVVAIIGIIAAVAVPSYSAYITKTKRVDGTAFLTEVASEQVRFFSEYNRYTDNLSELGYGNDATAVSDEGYYVVSATVNGTGSSYTLTAAPVAGGTQENDTECASLSLNSSGQRTVTGTSAAANCW